MSQFYFETLKRSLDDPSLTADGLKELIKATHTFFQVLRVKLESRDSNLRYEAAHQIAELKRLLEKRLSVV